MQLTRDIDEGVLQVRSCQPGRILVGETALTSHFLLSPTQVFPDWPVTDVVSLRPEDFTDVIELQPDLVVLGTGTQLVFPEPLIGATMLGRKIGFEVMDSKAACRTFNILAMEGRAVVAAVLQLSAK